MQVQCSNIHFHAHPDGCTTIHQHKTCRRNNNSRKLQQEETDDETDVDDLDSLEDGNNNRPFFRPVVAKQDSSLSTFSQRIENERYQGVSLLNYLLRQILVLL